MPKPVKPKKVIPKKIPINAKPGPNRFLEAKKKVDKKYDLLKNLTEKIKIGQKAVERRIQNEAAKKSLKVRLTQQEMFKERFEKLHQRSENLSRKYIEIIKDSKINNAQKEKALKLLQLEFKFIAEQHEKTKGEFIEYLAKNKAKTK